ncbi:hypothetical protein IQ254_15975 [Nodosilinea sp. LEGE 07088]|uniref:hypothetical protein n=1 Tax=Nodosilinea sp. LEGE 07088 TaxID=2777968 RepID=UPI001882E244|nr:hypothetical protein [Nodosilinea sp. LEGE 07088]MBE9138672.1 hypothetical protein [Nodosilinea sp. LEGE 07088]
MLIVETFGTSDFEGLRTFDDRHRLLTEDYIGVRSPLTRLRRGQRLEVTLVPTESSFEWHELTWGNQGGHYPSLIPAAYLRR